MRGYFILNGQGGELDKADYEVNDVDELNAKFIEWASSLLITEGDTIKIVSAE